MKKGATTWEKFDGWFLKPIEKLKELPDGDGAFLAMSASLALCERYYRTLTNTHEGSGGDDAFKVAAAKDLLTDLAEFKIFWKVFRHGIQHQGMPRFFKDSKTGEEYRWNIGALYAPVPVFVKNQGGPTVITIDPWKFTELIADKFKHSPSILDQATMHIFGEVF